MSSSAAIIEVQQLSKNYGARTAVAELNFSIQPGEIVGLLGPNGAGKTTTMRLLTGIIPPSSGSVRIGSYDLLTQPREAKRLLGYLPEQLPLYPELTVREYLEFAAALYDVKGRERKRLIEQAIEVTDLGSVQQRLIGQLSRGYQQRVGIAQALAKPCKILILDEPTVGLDPQQLAQIRKLLQTLAGTYTIILSSHILQEISATCQRVIIIHRGRIVAQETKENLLQQNSGQQLYAVKIKCADSLATAISNLPGVELLEDVVRQGELQSFRIRTSSADLPERLFALCQQRAAIPYALIPESSSLEEVFLQLTQGASA